MNRVLQTIREDSQYLAVISLGLALCVPSIAQSEGGALNVGEAKLYPSVKISVQSNDNVFASRTTLVDSVGLLVQPELRYVADKGASGLEAGYRGSYLNGDESRANFADHRLFLRGKAVFSRRSQLFADLTFDSAHYRFGTQLSRDDTSLELTEPYQYNDFRFNTRYRYGARQARGNLTLGLSAKNLSHTNEPNPNQPNSTDGRNFTGITPYVVFSLRVSGDTRAFLDLRFDQRDYEAFNNPATPQLDNSGLRAFIGTSWNITGRSGGSFKVGSVTTEYDDSRIEDNDFVGLDLEAFYDLKSYSRLEIGLSRDQNDFAENSILDRQDTISVNWRHEWSSRLNSSFGLERESSFGDCVVGTTRTNREIIDLGLSGELNLLVKRWLSVGVGFDYDESESDTCASDVNPASRSFERTRIDAHMIVTL